MVAIATCFQGRCPQKAEFLEEGDRTLLCSEHSVCEQEEVILWREEWCWEKGPGERGMQLHRGGFGQGSEGNTSPTSQEPLNPSPGP